jgi:hypothetical protein
VRKVEDARALGHPDEALGVTALRTRLGAAQEFGERDSCGGGSSRLDESAAIDDGCAFLLRRALTSFTHGLAPLGIDRRQFRFRRGFRRRFSPQTGAESIADYAGRGHPAAACFSPDGNILFVSLFGGTATGSGMTCAITGPWRKGPL